MMLSQLLSDEGVVSVFPHTEARHDISCQAQQARHCQVPFKYNQHYDMSLVDARGPAELSCIFMF